MTTLSSSLAVKRALEEFAAFAAEDSAVDSAVYDLQAYGGADVPDTDRYAAITREGLYATAADAEVANMLVVNRRGLPPTSLDGDANEGVWRRWPDAAGDPL